MEVNSCGNDRHHHEEHDQRRRDPEHRPVLRSSPQASAVERAGLLALLLGAASGAAGRLVCIGSSSGRPRSVSAGVASWCQSLEILGSRTPYRMSTIRLTSRKTSTSR